MKKYICTITLLSLALMSPNAFADKFLDDVGVIIAEKLETTSGVMYKLIGINQATLLSQVSISNNNRLSLITTVKIVKAGGGMVNGRAYKVQKNTIYRCREYLNDYLRLRTGKCFVISSSTTRG
jgi:hypothetical protein